MDKFVEVITDVSKGENIKNDDDLIDRLNSRYTVTILVSFAILVTGHQYFIGKPITCWEPQHFTPNHIAFMNSLCWINSTYFLPHHIQVNNMNDNKIRKRHVLYYQWMPFILLSQAFFFYLPSVFWHSLNDISGVDSDDLLKVSHTLNSINDDVEEGDRKLEYLGKMIDLFLSKNNYRSRMKKTLCSKLPFSRHSPSYLWNIFLTSKVFYMANVIGQLFILNSLWSTEYGSFGMDVTKTLLGLKKGDGSSSSSSSDESNDIATNFQNWLSSSSSIHAFPLVTLCDFNIRLLGNIHKYTVQCVLPVNMFNEKIFIFIWFWYITVAFLTVFNFLSWVIRSYWLGDQIRYLHNHLNIYSKNNNEDCDYPRQIKVFIKTYLGRDGVFLIRLIGHNCNYMTTNSIANKLWSIYQEKISKEYKSVEDGGFTDSTLTDKI